MKIHTRDIKLFKNLSQFDLGDIYYDFHNDFNCIKMLFENDFLVFHFKNIAEDYIVLMEFYYVALAKFEFDNFQEMRDLSIDNLYRGCFETEGNLFEFDPNGKSYFYLEFYTGQKMDFWCESIAVKRI